jgi:hypothetical protein
MTEYERGYKDALEGRQRQPRVKVKSLPAPNTTASGRYVIPLDKPKFLDAVTHRLRTDGIEFDVEVDTDVKWKAKIYRNTGIVETVDRKSDIATIITFGSYRTGVSAGNNPA